MSRNGSPRTTMEYWKNYLIEHKRSIRIYLVSYVLEGQNWGSTLIYSNQIMQNSQITDVCNDGEDNDSESIGKGYPSLTHRIHNEIDTRREESLKSHIWTLISNYLNKVGLNDQYTHSMENDTVYKHKYMRLLPFFFLFFYHHHFFFFFLFFCLYFFYPLILWISINELLLEYIMKWIYSQTMMYMNFL